MAEICSHTNLGCLSLQVKTPTSHVLGDTADTSHICQFDWCKWVWWMDVTDKLQNKKLGRYLGPSNTIGDVMGPKVLTAKATLRVLSYVFPLSVQDRNSDAVKDRPSTFEGTLTTKLSDQIAGLPVEDDKLGQDELDLITPEHKPFNPEHAMPEANDVNHDAYNKCISARVHLLTLKDSSKAPL
jgi:hypothetical protein